MEGDPPGANYAGENDEGDGGNLGGEDCGGDCETSTLLSQIPGHSSPNPDEIDSRRTSEQRPHPHPYHLKNKYTFRSDSVYSDVIPMSSCAASQSHQNSNIKGSEPREKSGSLSSLKAKESKWMTLKKKLGKLNSHSHSMSQQQPEKKSSSADKHPPPVNKALVEKRSLFQRAKTLSILPVNRGSKDRDETPQPQSKRVAEPPELFNVGGEMNLIPLEFLIDVNDLGVRK